MGEYHEQEIQIDIPVCVCWSMSYADACFIPPSLFCWHLHNLKHRIPTVLAEETKETKEKSRKPEKKPEAKNAVVEMTKVENVCRLKVARTRITCILHTVMLLSYCYRS